MIGPQFSRLDHGGFKELREPFVEPARQLSGPLALLHLIRRERLINERRGIGVESLVIEHREEPCRSEVELLAVLAVRCVHQPAIPFDRVEVALQFRILVELADRSFVAIQVGDLLSVVELRVFEFLPEAA